MEQFHIEASPDWPKIALSVPCPIAGGCGVTSGEMCVERAMATPKARVDYHSARKAAARMKWEQDQKEPVAEAVEKAGREDVASQKEEGMKHEKQTFVFNINLGEPMPQTVQIVVNFNIQPSAPPPLVATPSTATDNLTVGVAAPNTPVSVVSGGTPPYLTPAVAPGSNPLPPGLSAAIDASGNLTIAGTPTTSGTGQVTLTVTDSGA